MAYTRTVAQIVAEVRSRGGFALPRPSHADCVAYLNSSYAELYDLLIATDSDRFGSLDSVSIVAGTSAYDLPADHLRTLSVSVADSDSESGRSQLHYIEWQERNAFAKGSLCTTPRAWLWTIFAGQLHLLPTPTVATTLYHQYAPTLSDWATDGSDDAETVDLVSGLGREHAVLGMLVQCAEQEGQDSRQWEARRERIGARIRTQLKMQVAEPMQVASAYAYDAMGLPYRRR